MEWDEHEGFDSGLDPEGLSAEDLDRFGSEMNTCPSCGEDIYDQAEICHVCGHAIERGSAGLPKWAVLAAGAVIVAMLLLAL